jgi:hypothetical protein
MGPIGCSETSLRNYHYMLRNIQEELRSYVRCGWSLKSRKVIVTMLFLQVSGWSTLFAAVRRSRVGELPINQCKLTTLTCIPQLLHICVDIRFILHLTWNTGGLVFIYFFLGILRIRDMTRDSFCAVRILPKASKTSLLMIMIWVLELIRNKVSSYHWTAWPRAKTLFLCRIGWCRPLGRAQTGEKTVLGIADFGIKFQDVICYF